MQILSSEDLEDKIPPEHKEEFEPGHKEEFEPEHKKEFEPLEDDDLQMKYKDLIDEFAKKYKESAEYKCNEEYVDPDCSDLKCKAIEKYSAPFGVQFTMLFLREINMLIRDKRVFITKASATVFLVVFMVMTFHNMGMSDYNGFQNFAGFFLLISDNLIISGVNNALRKFPDQRSVFMRDQASGMYGVWAFYLAFIASNLPIIFLIPSINMLIGFLITFMINAIPITLAKLFTFCIYLYRGLQHTSIRSC